MARFGTALVLFFCACGGKSRGGGEGGADMTTSTTTGGDPGGAAGGPTCVPPAGIDYTGAPASNVPPEWGCPCTRRTGATDGCSQGVGQTATGRIGPGGGTLVLTGQQGLSSGVGAELDVPSGALGADVLISIIEMNLAPPTSLDDYSPVYSFEPSDLTFAVPATFRIPWGSSTPAPDGLTAFWGPCNGVFHHVSDVTVDTSSVQGTTSSLGFVVVGVAKGASTQGCP